MNWFVKISSSKFSIDISKYKNSLEDRIYSIIAFNRSEKQRLSTFKLNTNQLELDLTKINYPNTNLLINSIKNRKDLDEVVWDFHTFQRKLKYDDENWNLARNIMKQLSDFSRQSDSTSLQNEFTEEEGLKLSQSYIEQTYQNAIKTKEFLEQTISNIENWNNNSIIIECYEIDKDNDIGPEDSFIINIGTPHTSFTLFNNDGKLLVDDIIDAGEGEEFFPNSGIESDYFNLIKEIRSPGSSSKGKDISLYTARPIKDRQRYLDNQTLPSGIFLTQSYNHAEGLASDLGGNEVRDIWKVRVNTRYLVQTLEGNEKQFQVVNNEPVKAKMELITFGDKNENNKN